MKKIILASACAVILILVSFSSVVSAQSIESDKGRISIFQRIRDGIADGDWYPGYWIINIIAYILFQLLAAIIL